MKLNVVEFNPKGNKMQLVALGDLHYGLKQCDVEMFKGYVNWIKETDDIAVILMGDLLDSATKHSRGPQIFEDNKNPQEQFDEVLEILMPIKNKIIGLHSGNHEMGIYRDTGIDLSKQMASALGCPYLGYACFTKIKVGKQNYVIYSTHGASGATLPHTKIKKCLDLSASFNADVFLYGHVHSLDSRLEEFREVSMKNKVVKIRKKIFILTGHFINYEDSYAEQKNYRPSKKGAPKIKLYKDHWDIHCGL
jgi:predicted phosphodiesterase